MKNYLFILALIGLSPFASQAQTPACTVALTAITLPVSPNSILLPGVAKKRLDSIAPVMRKNTDCRIVVSGYGSSCIKCQQKSWDRVYAVIQYLRQKGVDSTRFIFAYALDDGDPNTITIRTAAEGEDGPAEVPPAVPCLSRHPAIRKQCHTR